MKESINILQEYQKNVYRQRQCLKEAAQVIGTWTNELTSKDAELAATYEDIDNAIELLVIETKKQK